MNLTESEREYLSFVVRTDIEVIEKTIEYDGQAELAQEIELATAKRLLSKIENERTIKDEV